MLVYSSLFFWYIKKYYLIMTFVTDKRDACLPSYTIIKSDCSRNIDT